MGLFNLNDNPNSIVGVFALIMLAVLAGPAVLPTLISEAVPFVDEGVACSNLRTGLDRAYHQSLIGREVSQQPEPPISLTLEMDPIPTTGGSLTVKIVIYNETLGTVPLLVSSGFVNTSPQPGGNGLGLVAGTTDVPQVNATVGPSYDEETIHLLGPRQRCVHRVTFNFDQIPPQFSVPGTSVRAYYRNENRGSVTLPVGAEGPAIFPDQGLWTGVIESESIILTDGS